VTTVHRNRYIHRAVHASRIPGKNFAGENAAGPDATPPQEMILAYFRGYSSNIVQSARAIKAPIFIELVLFT